MNSSNRSAGVWHSIVAFASTCSVAVHRRPQGVFGRDRFFVRPAVNTGPTSFHFLPKWVACFALLGSACFSSAQTEQPINLDLDTCVELALQRNFIVRKSRLEQDKQLEAIRDSKGQFDPQLNVGFSKTSEQLLELPDAAVYETDRYSSGSVSVSGKTLLGTSYELGVNETTARMNADGIRYQEVAPAASIQVIQPLLKGGFRNGARTALDVSRKQLEVENWQFQSIVLSTVQQVVNAYADLYLATKQLQVATSNRDLAAQLLKDNQKRVSLGSQADSDIILAESRSAQRQDAVFQAELSLRYQQNVLKQLVSDEMVSLLEQQFDIGDLPEFELQQPSVADDLDRALERNPLFQMAQLGIDIQQLVLLQRQFDLLPTLDLTVRYDTYGLGANSDAGWDSLGNGDGEGWYGDLQLNVPIPNRSNRAQHAIAKIEMRQQQLELDRIQQAVLLQLDFAAFSLRKAWDRMESSRRNLELAERSLQAEEKKLRAGRSSSYFVLDQQQRLAEAQLREISSRVDYFKSLTAYHKERGTLLDVYNVRIPQIEK